MGDITSYRAFYVIYHKSTNKHPAFIRIRDTRYGDIIEFNYDGEIQWYEREASDYLKLHYGIIIVGKCPDLGILISQDWQTKLN